MNVGQPELEKLTTKATLLAEEFAKIGGDWHPTRMVRALRARFSAAALRTGTEGPVDAEESHKEIQAIGELILGLGGRESNSPGKVWSSPSDVPAALGASPLAAVASPPAPARTPRQAAVQSLGAPPPKKAKAVPVPHRASTWPAVLRNAEAEETLLCGPDWPRWRWSLRPSRGAPTVEPPKSEGPPASWLKP